MSFDRRTTELLEPVVAALVMIGWVAVLFVVGAVLLRRRDLT